MFFDSCVLSGVCSGAGLRMALLASSALAAAALSLPSYAADWTGATSTNWFVPGNWNSGVPANAVDATIDTIVPNPTVIGSPGAQALTVAVGNTGTGILTIQSGGALSSSDGVVGTFVGSNGTVTIGAGSSWTSSGEVSVAEAGTGTLTIQNGGTVKSADGAVGVAPGSNGIATVDGSSWTNTRGFTVGFLGTGALTVRNGGTVSNTVGVVGDTASANGTVAVDGSSWINSGLLILGGNGIGTLTIRNGGAVSASNTIVAFAPGSTGTLNIGAASGQAAVAPGTLNVPSVAFGGGTGLIVFNHTASNYVFAPTISGAGSVRVEAGTTILSGNNTYTGSTTISGGTLAVNGTITSNVTVASAGILGGTGRIFGSTNIQGTVAPGNSIGTLTVNGSYTQATGSTYQVEVNAAGQNDRINIAGAPGTATINGGTVQVVAQPGNYGRSTTYTILNATGGRTGTYNGVTSDFEVLQPSLSYDANNVFLTLALPPNAFEQIPGPPNSGAVGGALDKIFPGASGDFATVIDALAGLRREQVREVLVALSGQPWADFGTMNVNNSAMFMNAVGQQMALARGGTAAPGQRLALAPACEVEACESTSRFSVWGSLLGGLGSVLDDGNGLTLTYNFGGAAAGIDYRIDPRFLVGVAAGYTHGTQWVTGLLGQGWSDMASVALYGSFTQGPIYVDALAGYAYFSNQLQRQIVIPGLASRTVSASTGANTFLGQVEAGYKMDVYAPAQASMTPFGRLQIANVNQNGLTETGAGAVSLVVAPQTTNSLRTVVGVDFGAAVPLGMERKLDLAFRLGWQHEFAYTGRPITAAFAGAPGVPFTIYGATPQRDSAVLGLSASTTIAEATKVYLRYDGEIGNGTDNHALNVGLRFSW